MAGYRPTAVTMLEDLAREWGVKEVVVKDESDRFGLPAFKALGASWAVARAVSRHWGIPVPSSFDELRTVARRGPGLNLVTATDGNHGRALARVASQLGVRARIYIPSTVSAAAVEAISSEGAEVLLCDEGYDQVVARAAASLEHGNELLIQDTSWPGYTEVPSWIVDGYATMFGELDEQLGSTPHQLVVVPTGVGSLLQAALQHYADRPASAVLAVEPETADCVARSVAAGRPVTVSTSFPTIMAGLNCGSVSELAWPVVRDYLDAAVSVSDAAALSATRRLHESGVMAGPCGAAALAGAARALSTTALRERLGVSDQTRVVLLVTEGYAANPVSL
jgi:diaminopropionate ammonia-lyase